MNISNNEKVIQMNQFNNVYGCTEYDYSIIFFREEEMRWEAREHRETVSFEELKGKVFKSITVSDDKIIFICEDNTVFFMWHEQDCCEDVYLADITGDFQDIIGNPILLAEETSNSGDIEEERDDVIKYTFYKLATIKGYVDLRWIGTSNGYYSTSVDIDRIDAKEATNLISPPITAKPAQHVESQVQFEQAVIRYCRDPKVFEQTFKDINDPYGWKLKGNVDELLGGEVMFERKEFGNRDGGEYVNYYFRYYDETVIEDCVYFDAKVKFKAYWRQEEQRFYMLGEDLTR